MGSSGNSVQKSEEEWRAVLSPEQFRILRQKGTEYRGTGEYNKFFGDGVYNCAGCGTPLYKSTTKFDSGCGWPAFYEGFPGAITRTVHPFPLSISGKLTETARSRWEEDRDHLLCVWRALGPCLQGRRVLNTH